MTTHGMPPKNRGYHTANLINDKLVIFGGSKMAEMEISLHVSQPHALLCCIA